MFEQKVVPDHATMRLAAQFIQEISNQSLLTFQDADNREEYTYLVAYFLIYGYVPFVLPENCSDEEKLEIASVAISSTPWMGAASERYRPAIKKLVQVNVLQFGSIWNLHSVLRLNTKFDGCSDAMKDQLSSLDERMVSDYKKRCNLNIDIGWTIEADDVKQVILRLLQEVDSKKRCVLKLVTYHGRNWFGYDKSGGFIQDLLTKFPNLTVKILLVDRKASIVIRECENSEDCVNSSNPGVISLLNMPFRYRRRIKIRYYGRSSRDGLLRGIIFEDDGDMLLCRVTNWRFGYERPLYGRAIELHPEASLAILCNQYFERVFHEARPAGKFIDLVIYYIKKHWRKFACVIFPVLCMVAVFLAFGSKEDILWPSVLSIALAVWSCVGAVVLGGDGKGED